MGIAQITQGKAFKNFMAKLYGWGASIVLIGALFKIQHWKGAGIMLIIGLSVEAVIFFFSAFEPPHEEVDWSLVYPELAGIDEPGEAKKKISKDPVAQELDRLLGEANIGPDLIQSLGTGLTSLSNSASQLSDLTDANVATKEYVDNVSNASKSISQLSDSYASASSAMQNLSSASEDVKMYNEQVQNAGKNLAALNAVYELQLQDTNEHMKETSRFYEGINELMGNLQSSLADTRRYKDEVGQLANNLSSLNTVYGNMLSAMNVNVHQNTPA